VPRKAQLLAQLQRIDTALDRARERVDLIAQQLADRSAVVAAESDHAEAERVLHSHQSELRDLELQVQDLRGKLTTLEQKLYSGSVVNPKELGAMTDEARQYRNLISPREDRILSRPPRTPSRTPAAASKRPASSTPNRRAP
jgi:predicted  nucleic acid-binding Zn-ribbon protein